MGGTILRLARLDERAQYRAPQLLLDHDRETLSVVTRSAKASVLLLAALGAGEVLGSAGCGETERWNPQSQPNAAGTGSETSGSGGASAHAGAGSTAGAAGLVGTAGGGAVTAGSAPMGGTTVGGASMGGTTVGGTTLGGTTLGGVGGQGSGGTALPEGGAGGRGGSGDSGGDAGATMCSPGWFREAMSIFCEAEEVSWSCRMNCSDGVFRENCRVAASDAIRFCCPPSFMKDCR